MTIDICNLFVRGLVSRTHRNWWFRSISSICSSCFSLFLFIFLFIFGFNLIFRQGLSLCFWFLFTGKRFESRMNDLIVINSFASSSINVGKDVGNNSCLWLNMLFLFCKVKSKLFSIIIINDFDES